MSNAKNALRETLSALLDNEADDLELRRLLRTLDDLPAAERVDLEASWSRYHLAQSVLHDTGVPVSANLQQRIQAQLADEPVHGGDRGPRAWQQQLARLAVAASVAVIVVLGVQSGLQPHSDLPLAGNDAVDAVDVESDMAAVAATPESLLADSAASELDPQSAGLVYEYIRSIVIDPTEPAGFEHIADSPLYRLVNELQVED
ncbi:MAG: RseA family anti-sigma factor [Pseudohongiellaceae bacterium]